MAFDFEKIQKVIKENSNTYVPSGNKNPDLEKSAKYNAAQRRRTNLDRRDSTSASTAPDVKNAVEKAFERMKVNVPVKQEKTLAEQNNSQIRLTPYIKDSFEGALNKQREEREQRVREAYRPLQGKKVSFGKALADRYKEAFGDTFKKASSESLYDKYIQSRTKERVKEEKLNALYYIHQNAKRSEYEKVAENADFEKLSADPNGRKATELFLNESDHAIKGGALSLADQPCKYISDKERKVYYYYLEKEGKKKASEYYKTIENKLNERRATAKSQVDEDFGKKHKIMGGLESAVSSAAGASEFLSVALDKAKNEASGEYKPIDANAPSFDYTRKQSDLEKGITKDMGAVGSFVTQTAISIAKSLTSSIYGPAGLYVMSGNAAAQSTYNALSNGATSERALTKGLTDGFIEFITEKIPFDEYFNLVKGGKVKSAKDFLKNFAKQAVVEGSGEVIAEYLDVAADKFIMGDKSDYNALVNDFIKQGLSREEATHKADMQVLLINPVLAFTGGALSGATTGSVGQAVGYFSERFAKNKSNVNNEENLKAAENVFAKNEQGSNLGNTEEVLSSENGEKLKYKIDDDFNASYDKWVSGGRKSRMAILVGKTSEALKSIGVKEQNIIWDTTKINSSLRKHPYLNDNILKQVPNLLENPVIVMQSKQYGSRITMFGEVYDGDGLPIMAVLELEPTNASGSLILDEIKIASTHSRKGSNPQSVTQTQNLINTSDILYVEPNEKRTENWLAVNRLQLPLRITNLGSVGSVAYSNENVNKNNSTEFLDNEDTKTARRLEKILSARYGVKVVHYSEENGAKGYYDINTRKMYINDYYANQYHTVAHEFFHAYKDVDKEGYDLLKKVVLADLDLAEYGKYKQRQLKLCEENGISTENVNIDDMIAEEIISDLGAEVLKNPKALESIMERYNNTSFISKLVDFVKKCAAKIREYLDVGNIENDEDIRKLVKSYSEIEEIYNSILASGGRMNYESKNKSEDVKYKLGYTTDNSPVAIIDENILEGVPESEWIKTVKNVMKEKFPGGIPLSGRVINISKRTRDEFTNSTYTRKIEKKNSAVYNDKLKSANNLDDIMKASGNYVNEAPKHPRSDNFKDFARGEVLLRIGGNDYKAEVIVGNTASGKMHLYDVINFVPAVLNIKENNRRGIRSPKKESLRTETVVHGDSLTQQSENVKKNISTNFEGRGENKSEGIKYKLVHNVVDENLNRYENAVLLDTDIFVNKSPKLYGKILKDYIYKNLAGKKIKVYDKNGNIETIEFAGEKERITKEGSKNSHRVIDKLAFKKDFRSQVTSAHADEIIQIAEGNEFNNEHTHQWLDENGWDFKTATLIDKNGNIFSATLNIANARDGRKILYDINKIKNIGRATLPTTAYEERKRTGWHANSDIYGESITRQNENVKKNISTNVRDNSDVRHSLATEEEKMSARERLNAYREKVSGTEKFKRAYKKYKKTKNSYDLPSKRTFDAYKNGQKRKDMYNKRLEKYILKQLSAARSEEEEKAITASLDMFVERKALFEKEKAKNEDLIQSLDEIYDTLGAKRHLNLTSDIVENIMDKGRTVRHYHSKDFYRNMLDMFGKNYGVVKDFIDDFNTSKGDMARNINERLGEVYRVIVKELGISKGSRESAAIMWYGEGEKFIDVTNSDGTPKIVYHGTGEIWRCFNTYSEILRHHTEKMHCQCTTEEVKRKPFLTIFLTNSLEKS